MCGRYNLIHTQHLAKRFNVKKAPKDLKPNYNVAPGQQLPIIVNHGNGNEIEFAK
jgi:putative SOS response-associated peptidase YedK